VSASTRTCSSAAATRSATTAAPAAIAIAASTRRRWPPWASREVPSPDADWAGVHEDRIRDRAWDSRVAL